MGRMMEENESEKGANRGLLKEAMFHGRHGWLGSVGASKLIIPATSGEDRAPSEVGRYRKVCKSARAGRQADGSVQGQARHTHTQS